MADQEKGKSQLAQHWPPSIPLPSGGQPIVYHHAPTMGDYGTYFANVYGGTTINVHIHGDEFIRYITAGNNKVAEALTLLLSPNQEPTALSRFSRKRSLTEIGSVDEPLPKRQRVDAELMSPIQSNTISRVRTSNEPTGDLDGCRATPEPSSEPAMGDASDVPLSELKADSATSLGRLTERQNLNPNLQNSNSIATPLPEPPQQQQQQQLIDQMQLIQQLLQRQQRTEQMLSENVQMLQLLIKRVGEHDETQKQLATNAMSLIGKLVDVAKVSAENAANAQRVVQGIQLVQRRLLDAGPPQGSAVLDSKGRTAPQKQPNHTFDDSDLVSTKSKKAVECLVSCKHSQSINEK